VNKLKQNESGFSAVEVVLVLIIVVLLGVVGWFVYKNQKKTSPSTSTATSPTPASNSAPTTTQPADLYEGWQTITFAPENLILKFPSDVKMQQPTKLVANDSTGSSVGEYFTNLDNGFDIQIETLSNPSTNNSYGNTGKANEVGSFTSHGTKYYIVNFDGIALNISACPDKVCAYASHSNPKYGMLIFISYADPTKTQHQAPDVIPMDNSYIPTVEKILKSLSY